MNTSERPKKKVKGDIIHRQNTTFGRTRATGGRKTNVSEVGVKALEPGNFMWPERIQMDRQDGEHIMRRRKEKGAGQARTGTA